jgi:glycine oxidase
MGHIADVLVIGGGVIGLTTAYYLSRAGLRVAVADRQQPGRESSWAGAGIISPGNPKRASTPIGRLKAVSAAMFPELSQELRELTGIDNGYVRCGGIELQVSPDLWERRRLAALLQQERAEGQSCDVLDSEALHRLEPHLAPDLPGGLHYPEMAQVRNPWHLKALLAACARLGVRLLPDQPVEAFQQHAGKVVAVKTAEGSLSAAAFVIASGAWSEHLLEPLGWRIGIHPVRGQILLLNPGRVLLRHILQIGSDYLVPRTEGRILVGTTEERVGFDCRTTDAAMDRLGRLAVRLLPSLADAARENAWAGLRPGSPDGKPILGRVPGLDNLYIAAGHFRSGIHLSPVSGKVISQLVRGERPDPPIDAFGLERFLSRPDRPNGPKRSTL